MSNINSQFYRVYLQKTQWKIYIQLDITKKLFFFDFKIEKIIVRYNKNEFNSSFK